MNSRGTFLKTPKPQNENTQADKANPAVSTVFITIKAKWNTRRSGPGRPVTPHSHATLGKGFPERMNLGKRSFNSVEELNTELLEDSDVGTLTSLITAPVGRVELRVQPGTLWCRYETCSQPACYIAGTV